MIRCILLFLVALLIPMVGLQAKPEAGPDPKKQRMFDIEIHKAAAAFDKKDFTATRQHVDAAEALLPDQAATLNLLGALLYKEHKYDEALAAFRALIDRDPNSYPGYFNTAEVLLAQKKYDEALAGFERILEARPGDEICQYRIVIVLALEKKFDEARLRAKKLPNPGQTAAYYFANAAIEFAAGDKAKGQDWLKQSETFFPPEASASLRDVLVEQNLIQK
ncbi:MAG: tetratricopeptide repeat protein [Chthoniobacterales bacterium]